MNVQYPDPQMQTLREYITNSGIANSQPPSYYLDFVRQFSDDSGMFSASIPLISIEEPGKLRRLWRFISRR